MQSPTHDIQSFAARIERLEKQNRRIKAFCLALVLLPMLAMVACQSRSSNVAEAQRIVLRDKNGKTRIEIATSYEFDPNGNPVIRLFDDNGKERTVIGAGVLSVSGEKRTELVLLDDHLQFTDTDGRVTANLGSNVGGSGGRLWLFGSDSTTSILLNADTPAVAIADASGFEADLGSNQLVSNRTGAQSKTSAASLVLSGKDGKVLWSAPH